MFCRSLELVGVAVAGSGSGLAGVAVTGDHILALFIGCIATPCYRPVLQVGRRLAERLIDHLMCDKPSSRASWRILALLSLCITAARERAANAVKYP